MRRSCVTPGHNFGDTCSYHIAMPWIVVPSIFIRRLQFFNRILIEPQKLKETQDHEPQVGGRRCCFHLAAPGWEDLKNVFHAMFIVQRCTVFHQEWLLYSTLGMFCEGITYFDVPSFCRYLDDTKARDGEFKRVIKRKMTVQRKMALCEVMRMGTGEFFIIRLKLFPFYVS